ncbi:MAG: hypothetical protein K2K38_01910 [Clostridia bacterium]|nr:hypothetical protein [Clostridia bacterium]
MSNWQKVSLRDAVGKVVFDEEWGFIKFDGAISYSVGGQELGYYYVEEKGIKNRIMLQNYTVKDLISLFSKEIYEYNRNYRYYSRQQEYKKVAVEEITVNIRVLSAKKDAYGRMGSDIYSFKITKDDKKRLEYLRNVWICDEIQSDDFNPDDYLKRPYFNDLKVGDEILYGGKKYSIKKVYKQPNESGYMISASPSYEGAKSTTANIKFSDNIYILPYNEKPVSETEQFNTYKNEFALSPYAVKSGTCLNVYWNKTADAAEYIISLYKKYDRHYLQKVYHLKDYIVDRNDGFISIDGLTDDGYIVTVKAENRNGEGIALSRGILINGNKQCVPQYWKE